MAESDSSINMDFNETYKPLGKRDYIQGKTSYFYEHIYIRRGVIWFSFTCLIISIVLLLDLLLLSKQRYENIEIQYMIDINNDIDKNTIEKVKYRHVLMDAPTIYINRHDLKKMDLKEAGNSLGKNTALSIVEMSLVTNHVSKRSK